ncbi:MAG: LamG-like jellyroll fold domain-containing protein, partial [Flavobacteriales bacterium]
NTFDNGYMLGIDQGQIYPEIWAPNQSEITDGFMPPVPEPYYWIHLATTWERNGFFTGYINGEQVGQITTGDNDISPNNSDLIIGIAPWDLSNFQTFGQIDEVRVWNVSRSAEEVKQDMFRNLSGTEDGLVLYYDFDGASGTSVTDLSAAGNDGEVINPSGNDFAPSNAVIGNDEAQAMMDLNGLWNAIGFSDPRFVTTDNGLSVLASNIPDVDYMVYGHQGGSGTSIANLPAVTALDFERTEREWYMSSAGSISGDLIFNLENAAGGGSALDASYPAEFYTLLYRGSTSEDFQALYVASSIDAGAAVFTNIPMIDGYYAIGVGSEATPTTTNINENSFQSNLSIYPNPTEGVVNISFAPMSSLFGYEVMDLTGKIVAQNSSLNGFKGVEKLNLEQFESGYYMIRVFDGDQQLTRKVVLN